MGRLTSMLFVAWGVLTCVLVLALFQAQTENRALRERAQILEKLDRTVMLYCEGVQRVNNLCERQLSTVLGQLGISPGPSWKGGGVGGPGPERK